ncbi:hypothetical protein SHEEN_55 [Mycobacterium phage Sheen]|uniref:DUF6378 domain-containing protein n=1 Tax=Mycobacterium phage Sheen TaxID=1589274 RepID=A0A0B5A0X0_9CAUD|nr:phosphofructokinase [Mycobacterium phage Sheen]AJD82473.1 hypothetical protein SHEEN_55 [Mycobacterium phage Sheen]
MSESILQEAQRLIHGERIKNYGHPRENFKDIALLFSGYLEKEITDIDVANLMILMKVARVKGTGYHRDSFTDIAGYAGCVERIYEEDEEPAVDGPKQYSSLAQVPVGVVVVDRFGEDRWRISESSGLLEVKFADSKRWEDDTAHRYNAPLTDWDHYGPFTEVAK